MKEALDVLQMQFPHLDGFQETILGENLQFRAVSRNNMQILNVSRMHWVSTSSDDKGNVFLHDSMFGGSLDSSLQNQIATIYRTHNTYIDVIVPPVQQQNGGSDCGLFAIAFLVEVVSGGDVATAVFRQAQMRRHLAKCIRFKEFTTFPKNNYKGKKVTRDKSILRLPSSGVLRIDDV